MTTFGAEIAAALPEMRELAESRMTDTCLITAPGEGQGPWNPSTGSYDPPASVAVYGPAVAPHFGKCRLKMDSVANPSASTPGPESWLVREPILSLPIVGTESVGATNQILEFTAAAFDQALVGRKFGFTGTAAESQATARRLRVKEQVG